MSYSDCPAFFMTYFDKFFKLFYYIFLFLDIVEKYIAGCCRDVERGGNFGSERVLRDKTIYKKKPFSFIVPRICPIFSGLLVNLEPA